MPIAPRDLEYLRAPESIAEREQPQHEEAPNRVPHPQPLRTIRHLSPTPCRITRSCCASTCIQLYMYEGFIGFSLLPAYRYFIFAPGIIFEDRRARMIMIARSKEHGRLFRTSYHDHTSASIFKNYAGRKYELTKGR